VGATTQKSNKPSTMRWITLAVELSVTQQDCSSGRSRYFCRFYPDILLQGKHDNRWSLRADQDLNRTLSESNLWPLSVQSVGTVMSAHISCGTSSLCCTTHGYACTVRIERGGNQSGGPGFVTAYKFALFLNAERPTQIFASVTNSTTATQSSLPS
jgi:hypothetical protein